MYLLYVYININIYILGHMSCHQSTYIPTKTEGVNDQEEFWSRNANAHHDFTTKMIAWVLGPSLNLDPLSLNFWPLLDWALRHDIHSWHIAHTGGCGFVQKTIDLLVLYCLMLLSINSKCIRPAWPSCTGSSTSTRWAVSMIWTSTNPFLTRLATFRHGMPKGRKWPTP